MESEAHNENCPYLAINPHAHCSLTANHEEKEERSCDVIDGVVDTYENCLCYKAQKELHRRLGATLIIPSM